MEEIMTQETNQLTSLSSWWNDQNFPGKEMYEITESGELVLKLNGNGKRTIATLTPENADAVLKALMEKFPEVEAKMKELQAEWDTIEDKQKLVGKVERMREYLKHVNAVGDFNALFQPLGEMGKAIHAGMEENHEAKLKLVQQAEALADSSEWKETTQKLKDVTEQWKKTGNADKHRSDELWNRLEAARNKFFDRKREHQEEISKEMLANLDLKMELVEKAENLAKSENWKESTEAFKQLMDEWKKTGRTTHEKNEELWNRFIQAKNVFFERKKAHFETIQHEQEANYQLKQALVEKAEAMKDNTDWNKTSQAYADLMDEWKHIGKVPMDKADELWTRLSAARDHFFQAKRQHNATMRVTLDDNYAQKMALLKRAEDLQHSTQWREATAEMNELMAEWKKIGPVPREHSNKIWEQFLGARKKFFERKDANREKRMQRVEQQRTARAQQTHHFYHKLEDELREEEDRLTDFRQGLENITPGKKEKELREHLEKLITQTEHKIKHKREKLDQLIKQMETLGDKPDEHNEPVAEEEPGEQ